MSICEKIYHMIVAWLNTALAISMIHLMLTCEVEALWARVLLCFVSAMPIVAAICHIRQIPLAREENKNDHEKEP